MVMNDLSNTDIGVSAFSSEMTKATEYTRIQREIDTSEEEAAIQRWKEQHNSLSPIARLPPELLSDIFLLKAHAEREESSNLDWIRVSHVCTHWRNVTLECPQFWSYMTYAHPTWAVEMLRRSKQAPLTVVAIIRQLSLDSTAGSIVRSVFGHLWRIRELSLIHDTGGPVELLQDLLIDLEAPAPLLEMLSITFKALHSDSKLNAGVFQRTPRLRHLVLKLCGLTWTSPLPCTLTSLEIAYPPPRGGPSIDQMLIALEGLQALTTLKLRMVLGPNSPDDDTSIRKPVHLPSLTSLKISSSLDGCIKFLKYLDYASKAKLCIVCVVATVAIHRLHDFGARVNEKMERPRCASIEDGTTTVILKAWKDPGTHLGPPATTPDTSIRFLTGLQDQDVLVPQVLQPVWRALPMQDLHTLHIPGGLHMEPAVWLDMFGRLPALATIHIIGCAANFTSALGEDDSESVFPALRHLVCEDSGDIEYKEALKACEKARSTHPVPFRVSFV